MFAHQITDVTGRQVTVMLLHGKKDRLLGRAVETRAFHVGSVRL
jgi:hypothetical protein